MPRDIYAVHASSPFFTTLVLALHPLVFHCVVWSPIHVHRPTTWRLSKLHSSLGTRHKSVLCALRRVSVCHQQAQCVASASHNSAQHNRVLPSADYVCSLLKFTSQISESKPWQSLPSFELCRFAIPFRFSLAQPCMLVRYRPGTIREPSHPLTTACEN